jgi:hypothetical protein
VLLEALTGLTKKISGFFQFSFCDINIHFTAHNCKAATVRSWEIIILLLFSFHSNSSVNQLFL